jgi:hypothetical protein
VLLSLLREELQAAPIHLRDQIWIKWSGKFHVAPLLYKGNHAAELWDIFEKFPIVCGMSGDLDLDFRTHTGTGGGRRRLMEV